MVGRPGEFRATSVVTAPERAAGRVDALATQHATAVASGWSPVKQASVFAVLAFLLRTPFLIRYDLHFAGDSATCYLMALRIARGDRPFYFYGQDYQGATESYLTAPLLQLFGPSIPLAATVTLLEWSLAVGVGVYLARRGTNSATAAIAGIVAAVGVPYTIHYSAVPYIGYAGSLLIGMLVLLQTFLILERGVSVRRAFLLGGTIGLGLYVGKQCVPAVGAAALTLAVYRTPRSSPRHMLQPACLAAAVLGFSLGYLPEAVYRLQHPQWRSFMRVASLPWLLGNARNLPWGIAAFFDAQPVSRMPDSTYFFSRSPTSLVYPEDPFDLLLLIVAAATLILALTWVVRGYARTNTAMFLLALAIFTNITAVLTSRESGGSFLSVRRYLFGAAIAFSLWTGFLMAILRGAKWKTVRAIGWLVLAGFVARVWMHEYLLLRAPDEHRELRSIISDLRAQGLTRGAASWGLAFTIDALTNEQIVIAPLEGGFIDEYNRLVSEAERIAVIGPNDSGAARNVVVRGTVFTPIAAPHQGETLQWALYRKQPAPLDK